MQWLTVEQYREVLRSVGFEDPVVTLHEKPLSLESLEDIGSFSLFIEGALPGVPLEMGAEALRRGVNQAFQELQLSVMPRNWLQVIARRPLTG